MHVLSRFSFIQLFATLCTVARQAPLSMGFSRQEYWSGLPCPPPGDLPDSGIEPVSLMSPALAGGFFTTSATWEALLSHTTPFISVTEQITAYDDPTTVQAPLLSADRESYMARNLPFPQSTPSAQEVPAVDAPYADPGTEEGERSPGRKDIWERFEGRERHRPAARWGVVWGWTSL